MINDRFFWIYFIVTLFFLIVGIFSLLSKVSIWIILLWFLSNIALMIIVYHTSSWCAPIDNSGDLVCVIDNGSRCFDSQNRIWLLVNILFVMLLIMSVIWASSDDGSVIGIIMLFLGLILLSLITKRIEQKYSATGNIQSFYNYHVPFWMYVFYITIWTILTLYTIINL